MKSKPSATKQPSMPIASKPPRVRADVAAARMPREKERPAKLPRARSEVGKAADDLTPAGRLRESALQQLLGYQLAQASIVTIRLFDDIVGVPHGLRVVEYTLLALIQTNPRVSPAQLTKALGLSAPYITNSLDKLASRGLIVRETNENDRRGFHLSVTAQGETLAVELTRLLLENEKASFNTLTPAEHLMLAELLHKLAHAR